MIALHLSCSAFSTTNLALSASCAATCLASIAAVNSLPKVRLVMDTSYRAMLKSAALYVSILRISLLTAYTTRFYINAVTCKRKISST
ncbi:hypothetical protein Hanom_Chr02g00142451 [Helianthus anomalus]